MLSKVKLSYFLTLATLSSLVIANPSNAEVEVVESETEVEVVNELNTEELVNEIYWRAAGEFYTDTRPRGQLNTIFGWRSFPLGSFPENEIARDGLLIHTVVTDYYRQQKYREPQIRTRDLANPFNTSLRDGNLDVVEEPAPVIRQYQYQTTEPVVPYREPVRGLW